MFGFLNINKPVGMTSFEVVAKLRKILGIKKIGHAGTLDPFAQGVLPIAVGKATKLLDYLSNEKSYIATIQLGYNTTTYDIEGEIVGKKSDKYIELKEIENIIPNFIGNIKQIPPKYSAIKVNGKKLCDLARQGKNIENIPEREIEIKTINIIDFNYEKQILTISVDCSKGTYIRSLGYDIGEKLGCGAHLTKLIRTNSSGFLITNAYDLSNIEQIKENILNPLNYIDIPTYIITPEQLTRIIHGQTINVNVQDFSDLILLYNKEIAAIGSCTNSLFTVKKVFYEKD